MNQPSESAWWPHDSFADHTEGPTCECVPLKCEDCGGVKHFISYPGNAVHSQSWCESCRVNKFQNWPPPGGTKCPEDPARLLGQPLGMYHCPYCGCMQVAGTPHMCDPDSCLESDCECKVGLKSDV